MKFAHKSRQFSGRQLPTTAPPAPNITPHLVPPAANGKMSPSWTHLIRFVAEETGQIHLGQIDAEEYPDLGLATVEGKKIIAKEITGSIFDGVVTNKILTVKQVLYLPFRQADSSYCLL
jgi:hypothetical protein